MTDLYFALALICFVLLSFVVQLSRFNFCARCERLTIISQSFPFVKRFFEIFSKNFLALFNVFLLRHFVFCRRSRDDFTILPLSSLFVNTFFEFSFTLVIPSISTISSSSFCAFYRLDCLTSGDLSLNLRIKTYFILFGAKL